ncbi:MAG: hypothetical protein QT00_C0001G0126 [archaeon GW2011_AR5]|nr:MAG: hypothetical protein QT00_C0001G0126 [archaeon GW2011_AR5]
MSKYQQLSEKALAAAMAMFGFVFWLVAVVWHGGMMQPSMMDYMYPGFSYVYPVHALGFLIVSVAGFYITGWLIAKFYNWNLKRK